MADAGVTVTKDVLSAHDIIAVFTGTEEGRESMMRSMPQRPNKQWAVFEVEDYLGYEKPGQYGDEKQTAFRCVPGEQTEPGVTDAIAKLAVGDRVHLMWTHFYVTRTAEGGGVSKSPERTVTLIEPAAM